jgi:hypothetical protein
MSKALKLTAVLLVLGASLILPFGRNTKAWSNDAELRGVWITTVTQTNCQTGDALPAPPFTALLTFAEGGTMAESTTNPAFAAGQRGPGAGLWKFEGHRTYSAKDEAFLFFTTPATTTPPNPGFEAGSQVLAQTIEFKDDDSDHWTSSATTQFFDTTGKVYRSGCATAVAQRFE